MPRPPRGKGSRARLKADVLRVIPDDWRERVFQPGEAEMISRYSGVPVVKVHAIGQLAVLGITGRWARSFLPSELKAPHPAHPPEVRGEP